MHLQPLRITMEIPPIEYIVPALGIARNTIVLWTGADGDGKTFLVQGNGDSNCVGL